MTNETSTRHIATVSNVITVSRLILLPFIVYFLLVDQRITAFVIMFIALLTDAADGFLARTLHQESEVGKVLDPVCDKVSLIVILITLYIIEVIPLWGVIVIVARDVLILIGSYVLYRHKAVVFKSNLLGKVTGVIFAALILAYTIGLNRLGEILLYVSIPAILGSFAIYLGRYIKIMKGER
ncbi:hypothetical protein AMJ87_10525 [candidate division WOR_3 bacterium SM23_60]|uniref:CDP-diacylglycerol--glycerol-3-phosphate 3-phosphatidyltransferase n=1 Tax=candidate division WOR_3 bacterium SM23_60 TaxID=1703780 RepID=A0A0S8G8Q9_UNCW3|nr:MAG: hypothetical protein AMJ87_10525 [candidate division WOR_3 bacterium SM23_60]